MWKSAASDQGIWIYNIYRCTTTTLNEFHWYNYVQWNSEWISFIYQCTTKLWMNIIDIPMYNETLNEYHWYTDVQWNSEWISLIYRCTMKLWMNIIDIPMYNEALKEYHWYTDVQRNSEWISLIYLCITKLWMNIIDTPMYNETHHNIIGFLINVQVQGQDPHQWTPFQIAGLLHAWQISHQISRYVYHEGW